MIRLIIWALATGFVTGAVWFAIHFFRRGTPAQPPAVASPFDFEGPSAPLPHDRAAELQAGMPLDQLPHVRSVPDRPSDRV